MGGAAAGVGGAAGMGGGAGIGGGAAGCDANVVDSAVVRTWTAGTAGAAVTGGGATGAAVTGGGCGGTYACCGAAGIGGGLGTDGWGVGGAIFVPEGAHQGHWLCLAAS